LVFLKRCLFRSLGYRIFQLFAGMSMDQDCIGVLLLFCESLVNLVIFLSVFFAQFRDKILAIKSELIFPLEFFRFYKYKFRLFYRLVYVYLALRFLFVLGHYYSMPYFAYVLLHYGRLLLLVNL
jgi:hypothetical protein